MLPTVTNSRQHMPLFLRLLVLAICTQTSAAYAVDSDADGVADDLDNCTLVANTNQRDTNGDGFGNICDPDFNNNGLVDSQDGALLKAAFGSAGFPDRDLNGNGVVDSQDGALLKARFGQPPGPAAALFGLDTRPVNLTCVAPARPSGNASVATEDAFPTAPDFDQPTKILQAPGDGSRWYVLEKTGLIRTFTTANPANVTTFLDFSTKVKTDSEGGMLGMAFHPNFPATKEVYVSYTGNPTTDMVSKISRVLLDNATAPVIVTEQIVLTVDQPFYNHNGGDIAFGPDGFLYIGLGDGGFGGDPNNYAQNNTRLLGKMLRINVLGVAFPNPGYTIPGNNPFATNPRCGSDSNALACPEIYASGLRNPWRWSFDPPTGQLWAGDVGQDLYEEVDRIELGGNYGWRCREALHSYNGCTGPGYIDPLIEYPHANGDASITGGFVYRGSTLPELQGHYVFADFESGRIWALQPNTQGGYTSDELIDTPYFISSFGIDATSQLYFTDYFNGRIRRLIPAGAPTPDTIPADLAATGCFNAANPAAPAGGVIPYGVKASFWSDGAVKTRYLALPEGTTIGVAPIVGTGGGDWTFPPGTVLAKKFSLNGLPIETRLLMRHPDGVWAGYTYEWNSAGTQATRVLGGKTRNVNGQTWIYPSEGDCMRCHTPVAGYALGPETMQLNGNLVYPGTGRTSNQLATLEHIGMFSAALPGPPGSLPSLPDPLDGTQPVANRARAWLHTNCAQCHQPGGPTPSNMDLRYSTALAAMGVCNATPQAGDLGIANARLIAPGDASRSVIIARASRRDTQGMPPLASAVVDTSGVALLASWVNSLTGC